MLQHYSALVGRRRTLPYYAELCAGHHEKHFTILQPHYYVLSKFGRQVGIPGYVYFDPNYNRLIQVDPVRLTWELHQENQVPLYPISLLNLRKQLQTSVDHYVAKDTRLPMSTAAPRTKAQCSSAGLVLLMPGELRIGGDEKGNAPQQGGQSNPGTKLICAISRKNIDLENLKIASWTSEWNVRVDPSQEKLYIGGRINLIIHLFEECNIELNKSDNIDETQLTCGDRIPQEEGDPTNGQWCQPIIDFIERKEKRFQATLVSYFDKDLSKKSFYVSLHNLRRLHSPAKKPFNWTASTDALTLAEEFCHRDKIPK